MKKVLSLMAVLFFLAFPIRATVTDTESPVKVYTSGSVTAYPIPFDYIDDEDIEVKLYVPATGATVAQTLNVDYTIVSDTVTYSVAPGAAYHVILRRVTPFTQEGSWVAGSAPPLSAWESAFDKITYLTQDLNERLGRSILQPENATYRDLTIPDPVYNAGKFIRVNAAGTGYEGAELVSGSVTFNMAKLSDYASFAAMVAAVGSTEKTVFIDTAGTLSAHTVLPSTMQIVMQRGGSITLGDYNLTINGQFECGLQRAFICAGSGVVSGLSVAYPEWFDTNTTPGTTDMYAAVQAALSSLSSGGKLLMDGAYASSDEIASSTDNITIYFGPKGSLTMTAADKDGLNLSGDHVTVLNPVITGEGTFVTTGSAGAALIRLTGDYSRVDNAFLTDPEQTGLYCSGDYPIHNNITIVGGPYFADAAAIGTDRQHYGVWYVGVDGAVLNKFKVLPNGDGGAPIEGFTTSTGSNLMTNGTVNDVYVKNCWDHGFYLTCEGTTISNLKLEGCGCKLAMRQYGTATRGNVLTGTYIDVGRRTAPLLGDAGMTLENWCWSTVGDVHIMNASDAGLYLNATAATDKITGNSFSNITINDVEDGNGSSACGIEVVTTEEFSFNTFKGLNISNIGGDTDGVQAFLYIHPADTAAHIGNLFDGGVLNVSQEVGISANYLTKSAFKNLEIHGVGAGAAGQAFIMTDCNYCQVKACSMYGTASQMKYGYEEASSDYNEVQYNLIVGAATEAVRTATLGAHTVATTNQAF